jgi:hypothetical protein
MTWSEGGKPGKALSPTPVPAQGLSGPVQVLLTEALRAPDPLA